MKTNLKNWSKLNLAQLNKIRGGNGDNDPPPPPRPPQTGKPITIKAK